MARKVIRRTIKVRHTARPGKAHPAAPVGAFAGLLGRLDEASRRLNQARRRH